MTESQQESPMPCADYYPAECRCPHCGGNERTTSGVKGSGLVRYHRCKECGEAFKSIRKERDLDSPFGAKAGRRKRT